MASMPAGGQETIRGVARDHKAAAAQPPDDERQQNCRPACHRNKRPAPAAAPHILLCCGGVKRSRRPFSVHKMSAPSPEPAGSQPSARQHLINYERPLFACATIQRRLLSPFLSRSSLPSIAATDQPRRDCAFSHISSACVRSHKAGASEASRQCPGEKEYIFSHHFTVGRPLQQRRADGFKICGGGEE